MKYKVKILKQPKYQYGGNMQQQELDPEQIMQGVVTLLQEGAQPEEIAKQLIQMGIPQEQVIQIIQNVIQQLQGGNGQEEEQGYAQEQMQPGMQQQMGYGEEGEEEETPMAAYGGQMGYGLDLGSRRLWMNQDDDEQSMVNRSIKAVPREEANIEAEGGETALIPNEDNNNYSHFNIQGKRHTDGGVPLNVPEGTFIYSDTKKMKLGGSILNVFGKSEKSSKKYTPAALAKQYNLNKYTAILESPKSSKIERRTAELMIQNYNKKLAQLALVQEGKKGYPQGIPKVAEEYYAKTKAYVESQQASELPNNNRMQYGGEGVDQNMEEDDQMQAMYGMGFKYGGGLQKFDVGNEVGKVAFSGAMKNGPVIRAKRNIFIPPDEDDEIVSMPSSNYLVNNNQRDNLTTLTPPAYNYVAPKVQMPKLEPIKMGPMNPAKIKFEDKDFKDENNNKENADNKSNIEYGFSDADNAILLNSLKNLTGVKKFTNFEPTIKLARNSTRYLSPIAALSANAGMYNAAKQAAAMFAGPQSRYSFNSGEFAKNAVNIQAQYDDKNVQLGNIAAAQDSDTTNKQMMYDAQRAKRLYDAGVINEQQYQNAMREARAGVLKAYTQGLDNAAKVYNASISQSPNFGIDHRRGTIYFHSPKDRKAFFDQQNQSPTSLYASAWKMAQEEANQMDFKSDKERETYIDKAADYYSKQSRKG